MYVNFIKKTVEIWAKGDTLKLFIELSIMLQWNKRIWETSLIPKQINVGE